MPLPLRAGPVRHDGPGRRLALEQSRTVCVAPFGPLVAAAAWNAWWRQCLVDGSRAAVGDAWSTARCTRAYEQRAPRTALTMALAGCPWEALAYWFGDAWPRYCVETALPPAAQPPAPCSSSSNGSGCSPAQLSLGPVRAIWKAKGAAPGADRPSLRLHFADDEAKIGNALYEG